MFNSRSGAALGVFAVFQLMLLPTLCAQRPEDGQPQIASTPDDVLPIPPEVQKLFMEGDQLRFSGKPLEAANKFREARDQAKSISDPAFKMPQVQSAAFLREANVHYSEAIKSNDRDELSKALEFYDGLRIDATARQKTQAAINRASLHMKLGDVEKAADLLLDNTQCDWSTVDESQQFLLNYNVGRALDAGKKTGQALEYYERALHGKPQFNLAASRICDLALADKSLSPEILDQQVNLLISTMHPKEVSRLGLGLFLRECYANLPGAIKGLSILLTGWSMTFENSDSFLNSEGERLAQLKDSRVIRRYSGIWAGFERDIRTLIQDELAIEVTALESGKHSQLPGVNHVIEDDAIAEADRDGLKVALSKFTFAIANQLANQSPLNTDPAAARARTQAALARNMVAFGFDPQNTDAARSMIWCLSRLELVNPEGINEDLRNQVIYSLLREKEGIIDKDNKSVPDWQNLLKIHMLLAQLFQAQKIWVSDDKRLSATFHWEEARNDEIELHRRLGDRWQWTPALHENLAIGYSNSDRVPEAIVSWLDACDYYLRSDDPAGATRCLQSVRSGGVNLTAEQEQQVLQLEERIQVLENRIKNARQ